MTEDFEFRAQDGLDALDQPAELTEVYRGIYAELPYNSGPRNATNSASTAPAWKNSSEPTPSSSTNSQSKTRPCETSLGHLQQL